MAPVRRKTPEPARPARQELEARQLRALEEQLTVRPRAGAAYPLLEVRNPVHKTAYLVMFPEFPAARPALCTCTDYARRGLGTCKHIEAAYPWLQGHPDEGRATPPPARADRTWAEIDRRLRGRIRSDRGLAPRQLARPGAALFDGADAPRD